MASARSTRTLTLLEAPATGPARSLARVLWRYPLMTAQVVGAHPLAGRCASG
jgi:hypothetical protein